MLGSDNLRGAFYMMLAMAGFTINDACMKAVTQTIPLYQAIALRGAVTVAALVLIAHLNGGLRLRLPAGAGLMVGLRTLGEVASTVAFLTALMHMPLANLSAIMQSLPLALTLAAALVFREAVGWRRLTAIGVGFAGVLIVIRPGPEGFDIWALVGLAAVAAVVLRDLSIRRLPAAVPSVTVALYAAVAVTVFAFAMSATTPWQPIDPEAALLLAGASGFLVVGYLFAVIVMRIGDIGFISPFRYTALIWAIFLGWLVFGDFPDGWTLFGAALVIGSGVFTLTRERALARRAARTAKAPPPPPPLPHPH
ncbi:MAG: DMT family transporter [Gemmobacter sp.]